MNTLHDSTRTFEDTAGDTLSIEVFRGNAVGVVEFDSSKNLLDFKEDQVRAIRDTLTEILDDAPSVPSVPALPEDANHALIALAIHYGLDIGVVYAKGESESVMEPRRMSPEALITSRRGDVSVYGYDLDRKSDRLFRLDRIQGRVIVR